MAELQKKYITSSQLCERFCKSTRTLLRWQNQFNFPKPDIEKPPEGGYLHPISFLCVGQ